MAVGVEATPQLEGHDVQQGESCQWPAGEEDTVTGRPLRQGTPTSKEATAARAAATAAAASAGGACAVALEPANAALQCHRVTDGEF